MRIQEAAIGMGYDLTRFQGDVDEELICPICSGVLEEPLQVSVNLKLAPISFHSIGDYQQWRIFAKKKSLNDASIRGFDGLQLNQYQPVRRKIDGDNSIYAVIAIIIEGVCGGC